MHLTSLAGSRLDTAPGRARRGRAARLPAAERVPGDRKWPSVSVTSWPRVRCRCMTSPGRNRVLPPPDDRGQAGPLRRRQIDVRLRGEQRGHPVGVSGLPGRIKFGQNALFVRAEPASGRRGPSPRRAPPPRAPPPRSRPPGASRRGLLLRGELPRGDRAGQPDATTPPLRQRGDQHGHHHDGAYSQDHPQPPCAGPARLHTAKPCHARNPW